MAGRELPAFKAAFNEVFTLQSVRYSLVTGNVPQEVKY
jgi:hypothetical protein